MRAGQRVHGKPSTQGASAARGARQQQQPPQSSQDLHHRQLQQQHLQQQQQRPGVVVKEEAPDGGESGVGDAAAPWSSRQLLKKSIMDRRQARGLGVVIPDEASSVGPVQHELSPEEVLKKERRKEQNRRAAKKCRQRKKRLQSTIEDDYAKIMEDHKKLVEEKTNLRAQVDQLHQQLQDHLQSGYCRQATLDNAATVSATSPSPASLALVPWPTATTITPSPTTPDAEPQLDVSDDVYSQDFAEITPEQLADFNLDTLDLADLEDLGALNYLADPPPDVNDNFKTQPPESPASRDRYSVSSVASDWSMVSDQSQGFGLVPSLGGSPAPMRSSCAGRTFMARSMNSTGDWEGDLGSPLGIGHGGPGRSVAMECEVVDMEDDVFADRFTGL